MASGWEMWRSVSDGDSLRPGPMGMRGWRELDQCEMGSVGRITKDLNGWIWGWRERVGAPHFCPKQLGSKWYLLWRGGFERKMSLLLLIFTYVSTQMFVQQLRLSIKEVTGDQDQAQPRRDPSGLEAHLTFQNILLASLLIGKKNMCQSS